MRDKTQQSRPRLNRREVLKLGAAAAAIPLLGDLAALAQMPSAAEPTAEWRRYAGDNASTKYSALNQINAENFSRLKVAWTWRSAEEPVVKANHLKTWAWETTPLMIDGVL
jgi:glucose dehydrogenase